MIGMVVSGDCIELVCDCVCNDCVVVWCGQ